MKDTTSVNIENNIHFIDYLNEAVDRNKDKTALIHRSRTISYHELDLLSNRIAILLIDLGMGHGSKIGVIYDRSIEYVAIMFAIFKIRAIYIPMDPDYPIDRLSYMAKNSDLELLITSERLESIALKLLCDNLVVLDDDLSILKGIDDRQLDIAGDEHDAMYIVYTSGSTGKPKGVTVEHHSAVKLAISHQESCYDTVCNSKRESCLLTPFSFDVSIENILTLLFGHTVHIVHSEIAKDPRSLLDYLDQYRPNIICSSPSYMNSLYLHGLSERANSVELAILGGEVIGESLWNRAANDRITFYNFYGPSECTIDSTCTEIKPNLAPNTIGKPFKHVELHVLDENLDVCEDNVIGEFFISGSGVSRGYINNPDLTNERFIRNPHSSNKDHSIIYKTGDLGKRLPDGNYVIVGRADNQVKIRGYRIELNEIEHALRDIPEIYDAVVIVKSIHGYDDRIFACIVPNKEPNHLSTKSIKTELKKRIPEFMMPTGTLFVNELPFTVNGKVDKKLVGELFDKEFHHNKSTSPENFNDILDYILSLWSDLFFEENILPDDSFFELGGDSLLSMQMIATLSDTFDVSFKGDKFKELRSARELASFIDAELRATATL